MTRTEQALVLFGPGLGLDQNTALRLARGLGMGLAQGPRQDPERWPCYTCYEAFTDFCQRPQDVHSSTACRDLVGVDLGTSRGRERPRSGACSIAAARSL